MRIAAPVSFSFVGRWSVRVGLLTLVTRRVGSVTSTSLRVCFGDMRTVSGPIVPVSSGALPGHNSTTFGTSAAVAGQAAHTQGIRETTATIRFMVAPEFSEPGDTLTPRVPPGLLPVGAVGDGKNI